MQKGPGGGGARPVSGKIVKGKWAAIPTRTGRVGKALRRAARCKLICARHRKRLFIAGVLPVAVYGSEHMPCSPTELSTLLRAAVLGSGLNTPGVPMATFGLGCPSPLTRCGSLPRRRSRGGPERRGT